MKETKFQKRLYFNRILGAFLILLITAFTTAQNKTITGVVKDASGETIIGASITVKGTKVATITDIDGKYKLIVSADAKTLVVSYIGMETQEVPISSNVVNISLQPVDKSLSLIHI